VPSSTSSKVRVACSSCGARLIVDGPGRFNCPECRGKVTVREKLSTRQMPRTARVGGVIPWSAFSPEVRAVFHQGKGQLAAGRGPGAALSGVTRRMGLKPCPGCFRRAAALNQLGWPVVIGFTVVVLAAGAALTRWVF